MPTSVRLSEDTERRLADLARKTGRSKAFYIRQAIQEHIEDMEDYYLALQAKRRVDSGLEDTVSLDEIERDLGLDD